MATPTIGQTINCTQCGGELHPDEGQIFLECPYCSATVYLDKSKVVFHWYVAPTLDEEKARHSLARWMAGSQTVKDLDKKSRLTGSAFEYFPVWYFKLQQPNGQEAIMLKPAAATSVSELSQVNLPAGDLRRYIAELDSQSHAPTVPLETALGWLSEAQVSKETIVEQALVHIPIFTFKYLFQDQPYTAIVEAATGGVLANIYPAKSEAPFRLAGGAVALVFLCLATFPVIGYLVDGGAGIGVGLLACSGVGLLAAPILFALAAWVAAKI